MAVLLNEVLMALPWILANTELGPRADPPSARSSCCVSQEVKGEFHERDPMDRPRTSGVRIHRLRRDEVVRLRRVQSHVGEEWALKVGDVVLISGEMYTGRDNVHA